MSVDTICTSLMLLSDKSKFEIFVLCPGNVPMGRRLPGADSPNPNHQLSYAGFDECRIH